MAILVKPLMGPQPATSFRQSYSVDRYGPNKHGCLRQSMELEKPSLFFTFTLHVFRYLFL